MTRIIVDVPSFPPVFLLFRTPKAMAGRRQAQYKNITVETSFCIVRCPLTPVENRNIINLEQARRRQSRYSTRLYT